MDWMWIIHELNGYPSIASAARDTEERVKWGSRKGTKIDVWSLGDSRSEYCDPSGL